jgi:myo-inositol 2-dehydrogenase/D-chiro-inositol 1-dehydrogenase
MPADAVRVAVVGAGRMGRVHLDVLRDCRRAVPAAVVDPSASARAVAGAYGVAAYATVDELLAAGGVDAALIAAPSGLHLALVRTLAAAGMPVLCEKPCGLSAADARLSAAAANQTDTLLQVGYWRRFVPELATLRERLTSGGLGDPLLVACHQWDEAPPSAQFRRGSGGIAIDMAVHEIDQVRWLLGQEFEDLVAAPAGRAPDRADPDAAVVLASLSDGAAAAITLGRHFPPGDSCWLELFARNGYERMLFMWAEDAPRAFRAALVAQADAFADAVRGAPARGATADDAIATLAVAERIAQALAPGTAASLRGAS